MNLKTTVEPTLTSNFFFLPLREEILSSLEMELSKSLVEAEKFICGIVDRN